MMSYQVNDTLIRPFLGPDMTDLQYQRNRMKPHFFRVLQFNVYLVVKVVVFRGHFNAVQASCEIFKNAFFLLMRLNLIFSTHLGDRHIPMVHCKWLEQILRAPPFCQLVVTVSLQDWCTAREWIEWVLLTLQCMVVLIKTAR